MCKVMRKSEIKTIIFASALHSTPRDRTGFCRGPFRSLVVLVCFCVCTSAENKLTKPSQARKPSIHVCSTSALSAAPQFLNQAPPAAQQLRLPDFLMLPHLEHTGLIVVVTTAGDQVWNSPRDKDGKIHASSAIRSM